MATRPKTKGGVKSTALARVGDPLITEDGRKVDPEGYAHGKKMSVPSAPTTIEASQFKPTKRRNLKDLPADIPLMNGIGAVFMYTVLGVGDREIADALKCTVPEIEAVRGHPAYKECFDIVVSEFINTNSDLLAARIAAYSHGALEKVGTIALHGNKEENQLRASIDLLNRAGVGPKENEQRNLGNKANELRIMIVEQTKSSNMTFEFSSGSENDND